jgi:hypothetical protein
VAPLDGQAAEEQQCAPQTEADISPAPIEAGAVGEQQGERRRLGPPHPHEHPRSRRLADEDERHARRQGDDRRPSGHTLGGEGRAGPGADRQQAGRVAHHEGQCPTPRQQAGTGAVRTATALTAVEAQGESSGTACEA